MKQNSSECITPVKYQNDKYDPLTDDEYNHGYYPSNHGIQ